MQSETASAIYFGTNNMIGRWNSMEEYRACVLSARNMKLDVMLINLKCEKNYNQLLYYTLYCVLLAVRLSIFICSAMMDDSDSQSPLPSSCRSDHLGAPNKNSVMGKSSAVPARMLRKWALKFRIATSAAHFVDGTLAAPIQGSC